MRKQEGSTTIVFGSVNGVTKTTKATTNWTGTCEQTFRCQYAIMLAFNSTELVTLQVHSRFQRRQCHFPDCWIDFPAPYLGHGQSSL